MKRHNKGRLTASHWKTALACWLSWWQIQPRFWNHRHVRPAPENESSPDPRSFCGRVVSAPMRIPQSEGTEHCLSYFSTKNLVSYTCPLLVFRLLRSIAINPFLRVLMWPVRAALVLRVFSISNVLKSNLSFSFFTAAALVYLLFSHGIYAPVTLLIFSSWAIFLVVMEPV